MANTKNSKKSTKSTKETNKKRNNILEEDMENELVSSKNRTKKPIEVDEEEYDDEDYEKGDDEVVTKTTPKVKSEPHVKLNLEPATVISYVTLAVAVVTLIISIVILCKVNNIDGGKTKTSTDKADETQNEETPSVADDTDEIEYDVSMFKSLDADAFLDLFDKKDGKEYIVNVGRKTCQFSQQFLPVLQQSVKDYDYTLYYVSTIDSTIIEKAQDIIDKSDVFSANGTAFGATPSTYVIKDGKVIDSFIGYDTYENFQKFLEEHNVKKK